MILLKPLLLSTIFRSAKATDSVAFHVLSVVVCFKGLKITYFFLHDISYRFCSPIPNVKLQFSTAVVENVSRFLPTLHIP